MSKVTSVEPQIKNLPAGRQVHKRFNIFLDGQFAFGADEDLVVERRLVVGKTFNSSELEKLLFEAEVGKLMERMYGLFSIRQRSEKEVRDYLKNLSFKRKVKDQEEISLAAIDLLITKLKQKSLLNDKEFAKSWIEARRRSKQKGDRLIKLELQQKGIEKEIIEAAFNSQLSNIRQEDLAIKALEKKIIRWKHLPKPELRKKTYQFLGNKGFDYETILNVIEKVIKKE